MARGGCVKSSAPTDRCCRRRDREASSLEIVWSCLGTDRRAGVYAAVMKFLSSLAVVVTFVVFVGVGVVVADTSAAFRCGAAEIRGVPEADGRTAAEMV